VIVKPAINNLQEITSEMYQNALKVHRENDNSLAETTCIKALQMIEQTSGLVYEKALFYRLLANIYNKTGATEYHAKKNAGINIRFMNTNA